MLGQRRGDRQADPARRAGDDRDLAGQVEQARVMRHRQVDRRACLANSMQRDRRGCGPRPGRRRGAGCGCPAQLAASGVVLADPGAAMRLDRVVDDLAAPCCGALTLIIAISALAALLPALSIMSAALRQSRRVQSISIRASATRCSQTLCSVRRLPKAVRDCSRLRHQARALPRPRRWCACNGGCGPAPAAPARSRSPRPSPSSRLDAGTRTSFELDFHVAVRRVVIAVDGQRALDGDARRVHRHQDHRLLLVLARLGVGLAHQDRDLAARIAGARSTTICGR